MATREITSCGPTWLEYQCYDAPATVAEMTRIAHYNPTWSRFLNQAHIEDSFGEAVLAKRVCLLYVETIGSMFYQWARAEGMSCLDLLSGKTPTPEQWQCEVGCLYVTDICFVPHVPASKAVRAMMEHLSSAGIAEKGEACYFRRTTPGRPERVGWIKTKG